MSTFAFVYPGQGAQKPGMGRALYEASSASRDAFGLASETLGMDMEALCFEAAPETLSRTENAQSALFTVSMAAHFALEEAGVIPGAVAGFSLGECAALCAAGYISWADGLRLVRARADAMQEAAESHPGMMAAVLGLSWEAVENLCAQTEGFAQPVNDNAPGQTVVAGVPDAMAELSRRAVEAGAKVVPLAVSAAFHTAHMAQAGTSLEEYMRQTLIFRTGGFPLYTNLTGALLPVGVDLPAHMAAQLQSPVRWRESILAMRAAGIDTFVEVGEGRTLSALIRRIDRGAVCLTTGSLEDIQKCL